MNSNIKCEVKHLVKLGIEEEMAIALAYAKYGKKEEAKQMMEDIRENERILAEDTLKYLQLATVDCSGNFNLTLE